MNNPNMNKATENNYNPNYPINHPNYAGYNPNYPINVPNNFNNYNYGRVSKFPKKPLMKVPTLTSNNILKISFDAFSNKDKLTSNTPYIPSYSNPELYKSYPNILFIPTVKLEKKFFDSDLGEDDIKKIFLSPNLFNSFLERVINKYRIKPISLKEAQKRNILQSNVNFILKLFFKKGSKFVYNNTDYIINNYVWDKLFRLIKTQNQSKIPIVEIKLTLYLHKGSSLSFIDSTKLTCFQKKQELLDYYDNYIEDSSGK